MNTQPAARINIILYVFTGLSILAGLFLTLASWFELCSEACLEGHKYRIFGMPFEILGMIYFGVLLVAFLLSKHSSLFSLITGCLLAAGVGAEVMFLIIQKYSIGGWCPICISIAISIMSAAAFFAADYIRYVHTLVQQGKQQDILDNLKRSLCAFAALAIGLAAAFMGVTKIDENQSIQANLENDLIFGNEKSNIEIYVFTSWVCPACRKFEPSLQRIIPRILEDAKVIFVDYGDDPTTLNFLPYNISFMIYNKPEYLPLRNMLKTIASDTDTPTDEQIHAEAVKLGVSYHEMNFSDIAAALEYFKNIANKFHVTALPAFVILNTDNEQHIKLTGLQITHQKVMDAITQLNKDTNKTE